MISGMLSVPTSETDRWSTPVSSLLHLACSHQAVLRPCVISGMLSVPTSETDRWSTPMSSLLHPACSHQAVLRPCVISGMLSVPTSETDRLSTPVSSLLQPACSHQAVLRPCVISEAHLQQLTSTHVSSKVLNPPLLYYVQDMDCMCVGPRRVKIRSTHRYDFRQSRAISRTNAAAQAKIFRLSVQMWKSQR